MTGRLTRLPCYGCGRRLWIITMSVYTVVVCGQCDRRA